MNNQIYAYVCMQLVSCIIVCGTIHLPCKW